MSKPKTKTPSNKTPGKTANKSRMLRVGIVQQPCTDDRDYNLKMSEDGIRAAAAGGAQLVLLQELHTSLYFCQHEATELFDLAETIPGPSTDFLAALAKRSEEHTSELQSLMRISYAVFCLKKKNDRDKSN